MNANKLMRVVALVGAVGLALCACEKKEAGPAETVGKQIDQAVKSANEQAAEVAGKAQDAMKDKTSEAGKKIDEAVESAKSTAKDLAQKAGDQIQSAGKKIEETGKDAQK